MKMLTEFFPVICGGVKFLNVSGESGFDEFNNPSLGFHGRSGVSDHCELVTDETIPVEMVDRGKEFSLGEVTGSPEDSQGKRFDLVHGQDVDGGRHPKGRGIF
jgi:hypothetical protein